MLRDNLVGLIAPTNNSGTPASDDRSLFLENPRLVRGGIFTNGKRLFSISD